MSKWWLLDDFEAGLRQLETALSGPIRSDLERAGCIEVFRVHIRTRMEEHPHGGERIGTTRLPVAESMPETGILERMARERRDLAENARCEKSDVAYLSCEGRDESFRIADRFSAGVQSSAGCSQKFRRMKEDSVKMDDLPHRPLRAPSWMSDGAGRPRVISGEPDASDSTNRSESTRRSWQAT